MKIKKLSTLAVIGTMASVGMLSMSSAAVINTTTDKSNTTTNTQKLSRQEDMKARLAADVAAGKITQAQADAKIADMANHKGKLEFGKSQATEANETVEQKSEREQKMANDLASALGTTQADILAKLAAGSSPKDIIAASGKDVATIEAKLDAIRQADMKARLAADVASGKITQAQADQMTTDMENHKGGPGFAGHKSK